MKKEWVKKAIVSGVALTVIAVMLIVYFLVVKPKPVEGTKTVTIEIAYANKVYRYENLTTETENLLELLTEQDDALELSLETETSAWGAFIVSMKHTAQDAANGYYYTYLINGASSQFGISQQAVSDGDLYRFEYGRSVQDGDRWVVELADGGDDTAAKLPMGKDTVTLIVFGCVGGVLVLAVAAYLIVGAVKKRKPQTRDEEAR